MNNMSEIEWLMTWYLSNCNDDWEHLHGVKIDTIDNPGWTLTVDLTGTALADRKFSRVDHDIKNADQDLESNSPWWSCYVENFQFHAACGPKDLVSVLAIFRAWASETIR
jgi:hypothetical protein